MQDADSNDDYLFRIQIRLYVKSLRIYHNVHILDTIIRVLHLNAIL